MQQKIGNQLIGILIENSSRFISGEEISKQLGCSRTAVWKHIQALRKKGYLIESRSSQGYRLNNCPDLLEPEELTYHLKTKAFGRAIRYFKSISTTQIVAHQWAKEGAKEGAIVIAEEQTAGKGRLGNHWYSPANKGIWISLILRPPISINQASHITILSSLAVYHAIWRYTKLPIQIKWPNDLLINGKKICGILTELKGEQDQVDYLVVGVGINVDLDPESIKPFNKPVTSLVKEWGRPIRRIPLLATILYEWEQWYHRYLCQGFQTIKQSWEQVTQCVGKKIVARTSNGIVEGIVKRMNQHGALVLQTEQGIKEIYSAEIES